MSTITKERAQQIFLGNGPEPTASEERELARIALASLEAEAVPINDDMAYAFHHTLSDSSLGADEIEEIKTGLRAAFANVTAPPAPVSVPLAIHDEDFEKALSVLNDTLDDCGDSERGLLLALEEAGIEVRIDACRAAGIKVEAE